MTDSTDRECFPQLSAFLQVVPTLSHGNAGPEQGLSINKSIIDCHGTRLGEDLLIALRRIKHHLLQVGGPDNFHVTRPLLESVKLSRNRCEVELQENEKKMKMLLKRNKCKMEMKFKK